MGAILDGKPVDASVIDPAKHKYVGMWRPPVAPQKSLEGLSPFNYEIEWASNQYNKQAWLEGKLDVAQYVTISVLDVGQGYKEALASYNDIRRRVLKTLAANEPPPRVHCSECDNVLWHVGTNKHGDHTVDVYRCLTANCNHQNLSVAITRKQIPAADQAYKDAQATLAKERRHVRGTLAKGDKVGVPLEIARKVTGRDDLVNGDYFMFDGERYIALRAELLAADGSEC